MWRALTAAVVIAVLSAAAPARADVYGVSGPDDVATPPALHARAAAGAWSCPTLRSAVDAANANGVADNILIGPAGGSAQRG